MRSILKGNMELAGTNTGVYEGRKWGSDQKNRNKN
jgi:hypothetical protein